MLFLPVICIVLLGFFPNAIVATTAIVAYVAAVSVLIVYGARSGSEAPRDARVAALTKLMDDNKDPELHQYVIGGLLRHLFPQARTHQVNCRKDGDDGLDVVIKLNL
jgi:hypothetical protein